MTVRNILQLLESRDSDDEVIATVFIRSGSLGNLIYSVESGEIVRLSFKSPKEERRLSFSLDDCVTRCRQCDKPVHSTCFCRECWDELSGMKEKEAHHAKD